ncbi:MAG TPA: hypothetical protein VGE01_03605 [Fimbriimonas sp.]
MIWIQGLLSFLVWVGYGFWQSRRPQPPLTFTRRMRREVRGLTAAALLLVAVALLFGALDAVYRFGGFRPQGLAPWAWGLVTVVGLAFIHLQTLSLALIVTLAKDSVTAGRTPASTTQNTGEDNEQTPP